MNREKYEILKGARYCKAFCIFGLCTLSFYTMSLLFSIPYVLLASSVIEIDVPLIQSVVLSEDGIVSGGTITVTVIARSHTPVNWLSRSLDGPSGNIYGGGSGITFTEISMDAWQYTWTEVVSQWAPSGIYTYSNISVHNAGQFTSATWPLITFTVTNSNSAEAPVIESIVLSEDKIANGGMITATVTARSNAPVNWLNRALEGPNGNIYGGGSSVPFTQVAVDTWQYAWVEVISQWGPSGTYTYSNISVHNEGELTSEAWPPITFTVTNSNSAQAPVIESVVLSAQELVNGGAITVTVAVRSKAPVNWLNHTLDGPNGNIYGGGSGTLFIEVSPDIWQYTWSEVISQWVPSGVYTYSNISVQNAGQLTSEVWPHLKFTVSNEVFKVHLPLLLIQL